MAWLQPPAIGCRFSFLHLPCGRCGHSMCVSDRQLVIFGGFDGRKWLNDVHFLDTRSLVWSQPRIMGQAPQPRQYHSACLLSDMMYVFAGYNGHTWLRDLVALDLKSMSWVSLRPSGEGPSPREGHAMVAIGSDLYVLGGWEGSVLGGLFRFSTLSNVWSKVECSGQGPLLCGHSMNFVGDKILVFGGFDGQNWVNNVHTLSLQTWKWELAAVSGEPAGRGYHSATLVNKYLLVYGGYNGQYILGDLVTLDTENMAWSVPDACSGHFPNARNAHTMALLGSELYLFGGYNGTRDTNELHVLETSAFSSLHGNMRDAFVNAKWQDLCLISNEEMQLVHSVVIKVRCPILYAELLQKHPDFEEAYSPSEVHYLNIDAGAALGLFCEYLYSDLCKEQITPDLHKPLLMLAVNYDLTRLKSLCFASVYQSEQPPIDSSLASDGVKIRAEHKLSDLTVVVENTAFYVHRVILYSRCPYFAALLHSGMKETLSTSIKLDSVKAEAFEIILEWVYSDNFPPLFSENNGIELELGVHLLYACSLLGLQSLFRMTEIALEKGIATENAVELFQAAHFLGASKLSSHCVNLILREFDRVSLKSDIMDLNESALDHLQEFLPSRMKRQMSHNGTFNIDLSMVKWSNKKQKDKKEPVEIMGVNLMKTPRVMTIRAKNPSSPANEPPSDQVVNAVVSYELTRGRNRVKNCNLNILGIGVNNGLSPLTTRKSAKRLTFFDIAKNRKKEKKEEVKLEPSFILTSSKGLKNHRSISLFNSKNKKRKTSLFTVGHTICSSTGALQNNFASELLLKYK